MNHIFEYYSKKIRKLRFIFKTFGIKRDQQRTVFCNMCLGGMVSHDLGLRFNSPFVNLMIPGSEYVELLSNRAQIGGGIIKEIDMGKEYPVGLLEGKYHLHFIHYDTFESAVKKWKNRSLRMDIENSYCILVETASCKYEDLLAFDCLPYKHKIILVHKEYPELKHSRIINGYDGKNLHGDILKFTGFFGTRVYDQVDWAEFLELKQ